MPRAYYTYTLTILEKVSFDPQLFKKELQKAYNSFLPHERRELKLWLDSFLIKHPNLKKSLKDMPTFEGQNLLDAI
jgi:hypothetical protein